MSVFSCILVRVASTETSTRPTSIFASSTSCSRVVVALCASASSSRGSSGPSSSRLTRSDTQISGLQSSSSSRSSAASSSRPVASSDSGGDAARSCNERVRANTQRVFSRTDSDCSGCDGDGGAKVDRGERRKESATPSSELINTEGKDDVESCTTNYIHKVLFSSRKRHSVATLLSKITKLLSQATKLLNLK